MTDNHFSTLDLSAEFLANLESLGYLNMTPIQAQSLPAILDGKDVQAQAKTGSGKTAAFAIGLLTKLAAKTYQTQALVLCPTRELADQVSKEIRRLARPIANTKILTLCGGTSIRPQYDSLEHQPHIVVGTPGRILKHLHKGTLKLDHLNSLVLDEGDRMLDMGFHDDIIAILHYTPANKQTLLFSATLPDAVKNISQSIQKKPIDIQVESQHDQQIIKQIFYEIKNEQRLNTLVDLLRHYQPKTSVIFCNLKQECQDIADHLSSQGFHTIALHGDLEQRDRDQVLVQFANKSSSLLIATDVAARGLDIKDLDAVINYELSPDPDVHTHRIGRTGRAGSAGIALSLFSPREASRVVTIEKQQNKRAVIKKPSSLKTDEHFTLTPAMSTLCISGGRKNKIRPGDILGALTANDALQGKNIGKIDIFDKIAYVAIERNNAKQALKILSEGKIKGRRYRVRRLR